jgi:hypothetical protein
MPPPMAASIDLHPVSAVGQDDLPRGASFPRLSRYRRWGPACSYPKTSIRPPSSSSGVETRGCASSRSAPEHNERDHAAWTSSMDHIRASSGFAGKDWLRHKTLEENAEDLAGHADDFAARRGFTYSVVDADGDVVGCVSSTRTSQPRRAVRTSARGFAPTPPPRRRHPSGGVGVAATTVALRGGHLRRRPGRGVAGSLRGQGRYLRVRRRGIRNSRLPSHSHRPIPTRLRSTRPWMRRRRAEIIVGDRKGGGRDRDIGAAGQGVDTSTMETIPAASRSSLGPRGRGTGRSRPKPLPVNMTNRASSAVNSSASGRRGVRRRR